MNPDSKECLIMNVRSVFCGVPCLMIAAAFVVGGCASRMGALENHINEWMSRPVAELKEQMKRPDSYASKVGWKEQSWPLNNGSSVYVEPFSAQCLIRWKVSPGGSIIGYETVGEDCMDPQHELAKTSND